jgi:hypothetical protein
MVALLMSSSDYNAFPISLSFYGWLPLMGNQDGFLAGIAREGKKYKASK